jgi:hypothetical protein
VRARADLDPQLPHLMNNVERASDGTSRTIERGEKAVGPLCPSPRHSTDEENPGLMVPLDYIFPGVVAQSRLTPASSQRCQ